MTTALEGGEGSASRPGRSLPPGKTRCPLYRRLDGPQGRCGQVRKISPSPGFDPRTVQLVASRYTDWATRPADTQLASRNMLFSSSLQKTMLQWRYRWQVRTTPWHLGKLLTSSFQKAAFLILNGVLDFTCRVLLMTIDLLVWNTRP